MGFSQLTVLPVAVVPSKQVNVSKPSAGGGRPGVLLRDHMIGRAAKVGPRGKAALPSIAGILPWPLQLVVGFAA